METNPRPLILFHDDCMDGITSAWILWRRYFDRADYVAVRYGEDPPDCTDRLVYVLDFCYPPDVTEKMADQATRVVILDHHETAIDRFKTAWTERHDVETHFDLKRSGAGLTADYLNGHSRVWIVDYVEDRDLYKFELPHSKEINTALAVHVMGHDLFEAFRALNELRGASKRDLIQQGEGARLQQETYVRMMTRGVSKISFMKHPNIPVVNAPRPMNSEVLNALAKDALFAVGWYQQGDKAIFSLRSSDKGETPAFNVAKLCEQYGGGGHQRAAGFTYPYGMVDSILRGKYP
jgi:uncharacterized protein